MKKKFLIVLLATASVFACAFGVSACAAKPSDNGENGGTACNHSYEYRSFDKNEHTCICSKCGDNFNQAHSFNSNNVCSKCGEIKDTSNPSNTGEGEGSGGNGGQGGNINIFNIDKVKDIEVGFSQKQVTDLLGDPYTEFGKEKSPTLWEYYDSAYLNTSKSIDEKKELRQTALDNGNAALVTELTQSINELQEKLNIMTYKYIKIEFSKVTDNGKYSYVVSKIAYNSVRGNLIIPNKTFEELTLTPDRISLFSDINSVDIVAKIKYADGSYSSYALNRELYSDMSTTNLTQKKLVWSDDWASYEATISTANEIKEGEIITNSFGTGKFIATALDDGTLEELPGFAVSFKGTSDNMSYNSSDKAWHHISAKVEEITLPANTSVDANFSFINDSVKKVNVEEDNANIKAAGNCIINKKTDEVIKGFDTSVIPEGVKSIGDYAFKNCSGLESITIPDSVTSIGDYAFRDCNGLESIIIPDSVTSIGDYAFRDCSGLASITIGNGVTSIGSYAFSNCGGLESITVSENNTEYASQDGVLYNKRKTSIIYVPLAIQGELVIPDTVKSIGNYMFSFCSKLTNIVIPDSVTSIGDSAFYGCSSLQSITLPFVGSSASASEASNTTRFGYIFGTSSYTGSVEATKCSYYDRDRGETRYITFYLPEALKSVTIIGGNILYGAFENCSGLTTITIGNGVTSIGEDVFRGCRNLKYNEYDNALYLGNPTNPHLVLVQAKNTNITSCVVHNDTKHILGSSFSGCGNLQSIILPFVGYSIETTGGIFNYDDHTLETYPITYLYTFGYIFGTSSYTGGVATEQYYYYDSGLGWGGKTFYRTYYLPESLKSVTITGDNIINHAFDNCSGLTSVTIGDKVTSIGGSAFYGCSGLKTVYYKGTAEDWAKISLGGNESLYTATLYYYSETEPEIYGNYWHYNGNGDIAIWKYTKEQTYNFNSNGGTEVENITTILISESPVTTKEDWHFDGWYDDEALSGKPVSFPYYKNGGSTLYAKWTLLPIYSITYKLNGGSLETLVNDYHTEKSVTFDAPTKDYYDFAGWYDNAELNGEAVTGIAVGNSGDKTYYAKWTPHIYSITYKLNGGSLETLVNDYHIEKSVTFDTPSKDYYDFAGWYDNAGFNGEAVTGITVGNSGDKTYYAKWAPHNFNITYELNGGSLETSNPANYNIETETINLINPVKVEQTFMGWYTQGNELITQIVKGSHGDLALNAKWQYGTEGLSYTLNDNAYTVSGYTGTATSVVIPETWNNLSVTTIGSSVFRNCSELTSITIPNSVTSIGGFAFDGCSGLTSITIPNSVTSIGSSVFRNCSELTSITLPDSVTSIGGFAFDGCSGLTSIVIPNSVTSIGYSAFSGCSSLESVTLPFVGSSTTATSASSSTLFGYIFGASSYTGGVATQQYSGDFTTYYIPASLRKVTITDGKILYGAFYGCSGLTSITIGNKVTSISGDAFKGCRELTSVTIGNGVTSIGISALSGCGSLESITLPFVGNTLNGTSNTHLGYIFGESSSYYNSDSVPKSLKSVVITGGTSIGYRAFYNCSGLTSVTIPDGVTSIGESAFYNCSGLMSVTIPDKITSIGGSAFEGCSGLTSVTIGNKVESIGSSAFSGCSGLTSVTIGNKVESIGSSAFSGCSGLTSITIPNSVTSIGDSAFYNCSGLMSVTIGSSVTSISYRDAFRWCYKLVEVYNLSNLNIVAGSDSNGYVAYYAKVVHTSIEEQSYITTTSDGYVFYENGEEVYLVDYVGPQTQLQLPSDFNDKNYSINQHAFDGRSGLTSVTIPDRVTSIGDSAFYKCSELMSITIGNSVTSISDYAFRWCYKLVEVYNLSNLNIVAGSDSNGYVAYYAKVVHTSIEEQSYITTTFDGYVFYENGEEVYLVDYVGPQTQLQLPSDFNDKNYSINQHAFKDCSWLTSITIPDRVTSISSSAFSGCSSLESITLPFVGNTLNGTSNTHFGYIFGASSYFDNSKYVPTSLKTVVITGGKSIDSNAFYNCSGLTSITIPDSVTSIGESAFRGCSGLTSIVIPDSVTSIGYGAFSGCSELTSVVIPDSVTSIGEYAFSSCSGLTSIVIPDSVTSIGDSAFRGCSQLTIYCEAGSKPSGWDSDWNFSNRPVVWGYKG